VALNGREKLLLGGLTLVGLGIATYAFVHEPLTARRAEAREQLEKVESQLVQEQKKLVQEGDLDDRRNKVTAREQVVDSWVPGKNSAAMLIWHLSQAEQLSGARIHKLQVGDKSVVSVAGQGGQAQGQGGQVPGKGAQAQGQGKVGQAQGQGGQAQPADTPMTTLVVIPLEMEVEGKFAEHLIFNQYLEEAPLFLTTQGFSLKRKGALSLQEADKLVEGDPSSAWIAGQVLRESPAVDGAYRLTLYFKAGKPGLSTEEMRFDSAPGRIDPFVMAAVDEFIQLLQDYYGRGDRPGSTPPTNDGHQTAPPLPSYGQLG
jgi:hypothetical protein